MNVAANRTGSRRDSSIETLRGFACLLLVAYHVIGASELDGIHVPADSAYRWFADTFIYLRMPLFTFLSGYVYAMRPVTRESRLRKFGAGKIRRLGVPMLFFGTLFALSQSFLPGANSTVSTPWYLWGLLPVGPYWFLASMILIFLVTAVLERYGALGTLNACLAAFVLIAVADSLLPDATNWLGWRTAVYLFPFFIAGLAARRYEWRTASRQIKLLVVAVACVLAVVAQLGVLDVLPGMPARHFFPATVLGTLLCLSLLLLRISLKPLVFIGAFSFSIYTMQGFAVGAVRLGLELVGVEALWANFAFCLVAGIFLPIIAELVCRNNQALSFVALGASIRSRA